MSFFDSPAERAINWSGMNTSKWDATARVARAAIHIIHSYVVTKSKTNWWPTCTNTPRLLLRWLFLLQKDKQRRHIRNSSKGQRFMAISRKNRICNAAPFPAMALMWWTCCPPYFKNSEIWLRGDRSVNLLVLFLAVFGPNCMVRVFYDPLTSICHHPSSFYGK